MIKAAGTNIPDTNEDDAVVQSWLPEETPVRWWEPFVLWGLAMLLLLALTPNILDKLNPPTGDEPFYLMTAISILHDHDLDESNNYAQHDYWQFAPGCDEMRRPNWAMVGHVPVYNVPGVLAPGLRNDCNVPLPTEELSELPPHFSKGTTQPGSYTKHGLGLSFLIAPAYALGGRPLTVIFLECLTALLGVNLWLLGFETTGRRRVAWTVWLIMLLSVPILCFAFLIFPATPAALLVTYSWRRLRLSARARQLTAPDEDETWQPNGPLRALAIGGSIGLLPWLHSVYLPVSAGLLLYWLLGGRGWQRRLPPRSKWLSGWSLSSTIVLLLPVGLFGGLMLAYYLYFYGTPLPNTQDHAGFAGPLEIPFGLIGLLFDQKYGLFIYAPFYLLALASLWLLARPTGDREEDTARRSDLLWLAVVSLPYLLVIADYKQWWGEWCPPARYLMPVLPLLAVPLALGLAELNGRLFKVFSAVAAAWSFGAAALFMYNPHLMYNWQNTQPARALLWLEYNLEFLSEGSLSRRFPSYVTNLEINGNQPTWLVAIAWLLIALLVGTLLMQSRRKTA